MNKIYQFSRKSLGVVGNSGSLPEKLSTAAACHDAGRLQQAESLYREILAKHPTCAAARHRLGVLAYQAGQVEAALKLIDSAAVLEPGNAVFHMSLGALLRSQNRLQEAEVACRKSVELDPTSADAQNNLGNVLKELGDTEAALSAYETVLLHQPRHIMASLNLAALHRENSETELAFEVLASIEPQAGTSAEFRNEMGLTHLRAFQPLEAELFFKAALSTDPGNTSYLNNLGMAMRAQGKLKEALATYDLAIDLKPTLGEVRWNRSVVLLMLGHWRSGLKDWHFRRHHSEFKERPFQQPLWTGKKLRKGRLLVHAEQGVGDEILYASLLSLVLKQTPDVLLEVDPRLIGLMARSYPSVEVIPKSDPKHPAISCTDICARVPLPDLVGMINDDGPGADITAGYLLADGERVKAFKDWLRCIGPGPYVGISWRSGAGRTGKRKSIPLTHWTPLLENDKHTYVNLQYGDTAAEISQVERQFGVNVHTPPELDRFNDLDGLAALIRALDFTVTSSNVTAILAGALGGDVRALIAPPELWYWGHNEARVPFFPNMKAYRRLKLEDWKTVITRVSEDCNSRINGNSN